MTQALQSPTVQQHGLAINTLLCSSTCIYNNTITLRNIRALHTCMSMAMLCMSLVIQLVYIHNM